MGHLNHSHSHQGSGTIMKMGLKDLKGQRWWITTTKQCFPDTTGSCTYELKMVLSACKRPVQFKADTIPAERGKMVSKAHPLLTAAGREIVSFV